ncbi:hypothetical protein I6F30_29790 [Bradyrhizobium sp. NBAIM20]|uniref:hypothetical protein n=1 Tax=unclassified Bradyrhizobium TaxID=2631580 RepID=UPI001CD3409E|nr:MULTISPECIES: hypothetical protein [unclassified Bradyrhizobium]MCA1415291.1 hypothetical protein [Bradyrhizobium sp. NBAIM20]MCA1461115.1 hypothetical protein [Bradyrhizobium sp. NBAIM18]
MNRHPVDQLADVRAEIKLLREREEQLRAEILRTGDMIGDENEALLTEMATERVDLELMKQELGMITVRPYLRKKMVARLQIKPVTGARKQQSGKTP